MILMEELLTCLVIREKPDELAHAIRLTPHSREEYYQKVTSRQKMS